MSIEKDLQKQDEEAISHLLRALLDLKRRQGVETLCVTFGVHLIFDSFPDMEAAQRFASMIRERYGRGTTVHETRKEADDYLSVHHNVFPLGLYPPIVIVERDPQWTEKEGEMERELEMEKLASEFGGTFAGT